MTEPRDEITLTDLRALPPTIGLDTAARLLGIGRTTAQMLARNDKFPVPVLRVGSQYRVPTAHCCGCSASRTAEPPQADLRRGKEPRRDS